MKRFDAIRPFSDTEINEAILKIVDHPMMKALMNFCFPKVEDDIWKEQLKKTHSTRDFQCNFIYQGVKQVLEKSSDGLSTYGFEKLDKNTPYLYISNHRDIVLDTSLLNATLFENGKIMTASAIGDNLVKRPFMEILAKLNRNFIVQRGLNPRDLLLSSKLLSEYIEFLLVRQNRSVWIAQREGRTKDGNDETNPAVLKMIAMASGQFDVIDYFKKLKIVPVSISYEYDPTDALKMPQLMAENNNEVYIKEKNEDVNTLLSGIIGQKKRIHIHIGDIIENEIDEIKTNFDSSNKQIQALAKIIDDSVLKNYKLWPTNYIAYDILNKCNKFSHLYTPNEKSLFERRLEMRIDHCNEFALQSFLAMYSNPVVNKLKYEDGI